MKKSLSALLVVLLSAVGANALASKLDMAVHKVSIETNDKTGNDNAGGRACGSKTGK